MMKSIFVLKPGLPNTSFIRLTYYTLLTLSIVLAVFVILEGLNDPFGELLVLIGCLCLVIVPVMLRIVFGLLLTHPSLRS